MDEEPDLDEEDIDSVCLLEEVEEPSQRRRLLRGLTIIEFNESQIVDFLRIAGKKVTLVLNSYDSVSEWVLVKQILEWIPKVRIQNWKAAMNRPVADALYHLSSLPYERRYLEILKIYGSKTINWQRKKCSNRLMESVICLSECAL
ncbi:hypothetical protein Tcan_06810 [Toxocara canis]|uniref:Uncharacterized protein n=1 Tax=Toxocara canis TaxID=6265 RepID=A0A0B2W1X5_TOXCA|nr:hypothetical protein Tcan_06810 [Toxocara canis]